jgi:hypothetical protein
VPFEPTMNLAQVSGVAGELVREAAAAGHGRSPSPRHVSRNFWKLRGGGRLRRPDSKRTTTQGREDFARIRFRWSRGGSRPERRSAARRVGSETLAHLTTYRRCP